MIDPIAEVASEVPIYWRNSDLWLAGICIIFNPLFWNIVSWLVYAVICTSLYALWIFEMFSHKHCCVPLPSSTMVVNLVSFKVQLTQLILE